MKGQWARDWVAWNGFGRFATQLAESLIVPAVAGGYEATASVAGGALALDLRVDAAARSTNGSETLHAAGRLVGPDGKIIDVPMAERDAGRFRGTIPLPNAGVYRVQVVTSGLGGTQKLVATTGAVVPASAEYLQPEGNPGLLKAIANMTGGTTNLPPERAFVHPAKVNHRSAPVTWPLLWLAVLLWPLDIAARRLLPYSSWGRLPSAVRHLIPGRAVPASTAESDGQSRRRVEVLLRARRHGLETADTTPEAVRGTRSGFSTSKEGQPTRQVDGADGSSSTSGQPEKARSSRPSWRDMRRSIPERPADRPSDRR
jgi:hypothetical protein